MADIFQDLNVKLKALSEHLKDQLSGIRSGRPSPKLIEDIVVDYFDQKMTIKQMGSINIMPPRGLQVSVWDKQMISPIIKAIENSRLSATVSNEGNVIRISLPSLSEERRQELVKVVKKEVEEAKIKIRTLRDEVNKKIKQQAEDGEINEDDKFKFRDRVQEAIDKTGKEVENMLENKIIDLNL